MSSNRGFSLIETMIATGIMATALLAVAAMFTYSARTNMFTEQMTTGVLLANTKMEELRTVTPITNLTIGGGLDAANPTASFFEYVSISTNGLVTRDTVTTSAPYLTLWQIGGNNPRLITVAVFAQRSGATGQMAEVFRTTTAVTNGF